MTRENFVKNLSQACMTMTLAKVVLDAIKSGNRYKKDVYSCLCKVAGSKDTTTKEIWADKEKSYLEANGFWLQGYEDFKGLLFDIKSNVAVLDDHEELFLQTLEQTVSVFKDLKSMETELIKLVSAVLKAVSDRWCESHLKRFRKILITLKLDAQ